jgi:hypothetical protein
MAELHLQRPAAFGWSKAKVLEFFGRAPRLHESVRDANLDADLPFPVVLGKYYLVNPPDADEGEFQYPFWLCKVAHIGISVHARAHAAAAQRFHLHIYMPGLIDGVRSVRVRYLTAYPTLPKGVTGTDTEALHTKKAMPTFDWYTEDYWIDHADTPDSEVPNHIPIRSLNLPVEMIKGTKQYQNQKAVRMSKRAKVVQEVKNWVERFQGICVFLSKVVV